MSKFAWTEEHLNALHESDYECECGGLYFPEHDWKCCDCDEKGEPSELPKVKSDEIKELKEKISILKKALEIASYQHGFRLEYYLNEARDLVEVKK